MYCVRHTVTRIPIEQANSFANILSIKNDIKFIHKIKTSLSSFCIIFVHDYTLVCNSEKKMAANENKVDKIVKKFNMCPHPEGGFYKRIFESSTTIHTPFGKRFSMTSINYLMTYGNFNAFHLLKQNSEVLYFHDVSFPKGLYLSKVIID